MKLSGTLLLERSVYRSPAFSFQLQHNLRNPSHSRNSHRSKCKTHTSHESPPPLLSCIYPPCPTRKKKKKPLIPAASTQHGSYAPRIPGAIRYRVHRRPHDALLPGLVRAPFDPDVRDAGIGRHLFRAYTSLSPCQQSVFSLSVRSALLGGALSPGDSVHPFFPGRNVM